MKRPHPGNPVLSEAQVREILRSDLTATVLAGIYGVSDGNVRCIKQRKSWRGLEEIYPGEFKPLTSANDVRSGGRNNNAKLTAADVIAIRQDHRPSSALAAEYGVKWHTIHKIRMRQTWKELP